MPLAYFSNEPATWSASSRVGATTRLRGIRALARPADRRSIMGRVKAAVLPVPVWAMPSTSRPARGDRDRLLLDGGGRRVAGVVGHRLHGGGAEPQVCEGGQRASEGRRKGAYVRRGRPMSKGERTARIRSTCLRMRFDMAFRRAEVNLRAARAGRSARWETFAGASRHVCSRLSLAARRRRPEGPAGGDGQAGAGVLGHAGLHLRRWPPGPPQPRARRRLHLPRTPQHAVERRVGREGRDGVPAPAPPGADRQLLHAVCRTGRAGGPRPRAGRR